MMSKAISYGSRVKRPPATATTAPVDDTRKVSLEAQSVRIHQIMDSLEDCVGREDPRFLQNISELKEVVGGIDALLQKNSGKQLDDSSSIGLASTAAKTVGKNAAQLIAVAALAKDGAGMDDDEEEDESSVDGSERGATSSDEDVQHSSRKVGLFWGPESE